VAVRRGKFKALGILDGVQAELDELREEVETFSAEARSHVIPEFCRGEEEAADTLIALLSTCHHMGWDVIGAALAKHAYNETRQ